MLASPVSFSLVTSQSSFGNTSCSSCCQNPHVSLQQPVNRGFDLSYKDLTQLHFVVRSREFGDGLLRHFLQVDQNIRGLRELFEVVVQGTLRSDVHRTIKEAMHKKEGYFARWFSNEGFDEWLCQETALGKVVKYFEDYVTSFTPMERFLERLDAKTIRKAEEEAQSVLEQLDQLSLEGDSVEDVDSLDPAYRFVATVPEHDESAWPFQGAMADGKSFPEVSLGNVPDGAVMGFHLERCPKGWTDFSVTQTSVPIGSVVTFSSNVGYPSDYLVCDGSEYKQQDYPELFAVIGGRYGTRTSEDAELFFNVPDYRGFFLRGWDNGAKNDPDASTREDRGDSKGGDIVGSVQSDATRLHDIVVSESGEHGHSMNGAGGHSHKLHKTQTTHNKDGGQGLKDGGDSGNYDIYTYREPDHTHTILDNGDHHHEISGGGSETRPKNKNVVYLLKAIPDPIDLSSTGGKLIYCEKQVGWSLNSPVVAFTTVTAGVITVLFNAQAVVRRVRDFFR